MPSWPTQTSWPNKTSWPAGTSWPSGGNWPAGGGGPPPPTPPFSFASLIPGAYQFIQSDLGLQYGAVMRADAGNTSGVAFALTGATPVVPVPIWIRVTGPGVGNVYYDGLGVTPAMTGVTIADSVAIILTGAALGMAITPGVGSQVAGNTWRATCSGLADQTANGVNATQLTPSQQPIVGKGANGKVSFILDGVDDAFVSVFAAALPPEVQITVVGSADMTGGSDKCLIGGDVASGLFFNVAPNHLCNYVNGGYSVAVGDDNVSRALMIGTQNTVSQASIQWGGNAKITQFAPSGSGGTVRHIGRHSVGFGRYTPGEIFIVAYSPIMADTTALRAALNDPQGYGGILV